MTGAQLPGVFGHLQPVVEHYGYLAVGGFVLLEDFGVPLPGETNLIAAAIFAGSGHMNIAVVVVVAVIAAIIGDNIGFVIGHFGGRPLVHRFGRYIFLTPERLDQAEDYFNRHGGKLVTIARFIPVLRQLNGILSGIIGMHWASSWRSTPWAPSCGCWAGLGYLAGEHIVAIYSAIERYKWYALAAAAVIAAALITHRIHARRRDTARKTN